MQDPLNLNIPLAGVETTLPLLPEQDFGVQVTESSIDPNKDNIGYNWNLKVNLTDMATAVDGREVKPNFPLFCTFALQPAPDSKDLDAFRRSLGETVDALFGTSKDNRPDFSQELVASAVGKNCIATVYIDEWPKGSGQKRNKVRRLKKAA